MPLSPGGAGLDQRRVPLTSCSRKSGAELITVVMLNWARPALALRNMHAYAAYRAVSQVLCFNNGPRLDVGEGLPAKCVLIEASQDLGLFSRLTTGALARTDAIFHTDDDILVPEETLETIYGHWRQAPSQCHGVYGRSLANGYRPVDAFGPVEIVLTRALMCSRRLNNAALAATARFDDIPGVPHGNGEDIILSFVAMARSGQINHAHELPVVNDPAGWLGETGIHRRWPGHLAHRRQIVARCSEIFSGLTRPSAAGPSLPSGSPPV